MVNPRQDISPLRTVRRKAWTVWFTGLSGSGKSTLAKALSTYLEMLSLPHQVIDGDEIRNNLCRDLGFSKEDRDENVRRIGYIAQLLNKHGIITIVAAISPYRAARAEARRNCARFIEVHVDCSLPALTDRDTKGLYRKALAGEIACFSGVTDPYEAPIRPDIYIDSEAQTEQESVSFLISALEDLECLPKPHEHLQASSMSA